MFIYPALSGKGSFSYAKTRNVDSHLGLQRSWQKHCHLAHVRLYAVANNEFVEYTRTFTNCYGTLKCEIDRLLSEGYDILLDINSVGAKNIKKVYPDAVTIFINPPSLDELKKRLVGRGSETADSLKKRLDEIEFESKAIPFYDFVVVNDVALDCSNKIVDFLENKRKELDEKYAKENSQN